MSTRPGGNREFTGNAGDGTSRMVSGGRGAGEPAERLRTLLTDAREQPACAIGAVNAVAATVAAEAGFDALWVSGLEVSATRGLPDRNVLHVSDLVDAVHAAVTVTALPVLVDVDNAGASAAAARRYAVELRRAGAAGICLEDSRYPKCNSFSTQHSHALADLDLVLDQIEQVRTVVGSELVVVARTESLICGLDLDTAIQRAERFATAGADAVLIHSSDRSGRQALEAAEAWHGKVPLVVVPTAFPGVSLTQLGAAGFRLCIYANQLSRAALAAMRRAAASFARNGSFMEVADMASVADLLRIGDTDAVASI